MSLKGWLDTLDDLTPRCPQCNRKMRNRVGCRECWRVSCSDNCHEKHVKAAHPLLVDKLRDARRQYRENLRTAARSNKQLAENVAKLQAVLTEQQKVEKEKQKKRENLELLKQALASARKEFVKRSDAWKLAGCPNVQETDLENLRKQARLARSLMNQASRTRKITGLKIIYLKMAIFARKIADKADIGWFVCGTIVGTASLALASLLGILLTNRLIPTLALGGIGFVCGFISALCLLFFPDDEELRTLLTMLINEQLGKLQPFEEAKATCDDAQQRYENLAQLRKIQDDYEEALQKQQRLEAEYQSACAD